MWRWFVLVVAYLLGCAAAARLPQAADAAWAASQWPGLTLTELEQGRGLYVRHCSTCHALRAPSDSSEWDKVFPVMVGKAKLDLESGELVRRYILTVNRSEP